ncbi:DUF4396 domain-containing protein [Kaustia mangrovi]|nr:DUF4396 domain-containing protein [Kaustia mangrovi]
MANIDAFKAFITHPAVLALWVGAMLVSLAVLGLDIRKRNAHLMPLMKAVWGLTVIYSGPIGLAVYWTTGRKEIATDSIWRRAFRSVAHCYSGCGAGEIAGVVIAAGLLSLGNWAVAGTTFVLAYLAGYALTVGPMAQSGVPLREALWDAFVAETPSITVMEVTAIGIDLWLAAAATITEPLFWASLVFSLSCGLFAAYPVNLALLRFGVKEGMMDPRRTDHAHA